MLGAASLVIAAVHPTYTFFVALPLAGFLVARVLLAWREWRDAVRIGAALVAVLIPASLYALWLRPLVQDTVSHRPDDVERARGLVHYAGQIDVVDGLFRLAPEQLSRPGAVAVAGLLAIPLAGFAAPRRWAAYVLGGSLAVLAVLLVPQAFDALSELFSLSQSRRLAAFLPLPFALAGAAMILGRLRIAGALAALGAGGILQLEYPGEFTYRVVLGGPGGRRGLRSSAASQRSSPEMICAEVSSKLRRCGRLQSPWLLRPRSRRLASTIEAGRP